MGIILPIVGVIGLLGIGILAAVGIPAIQGGLAKATQNMAMLQSRAIVFAMFQYSIDHGGNYPDGKTSTEVFQKLIDGKYASDPAMFYFALPGKTKPTSTTLTAENVCFDVTSGVTSNSPDSLPLVFSTGYTMIYEPRGKAIPIQRISGPLRDIIVISYKSHAAKIFRVNNPDGTVTDFIPENFDSGTEKYQQLTP